MPDKSVAIQADGDRLEDLYDWLRDEPEVRGSVGGAHLDPLPDQMADVAEIVISISSAGGVLAVLASSLRAWVLRGLFVVTNVELDRLGW